MYDVKVRLSTRINSSQEREDYFIVLENDDYYDVNIIRKIQYINDMQVHLNNILQEYKILWLVEVMYTLDLKINNPELYDFGWTYGEEDGDKIILDIERNDNNLGLRIKSRRLK